MKDVELAYEGNTDLAFDTDVLTEAGDKYAEIAVELRKMSQKLDDAISELKDSGWTTPAGTAFYAMTQTNWEKNIEKYAALLDMLKEVLYEAAASYENLMNENVLETKVGTQQWA